MVFKLSDVVAHCDGFIQGSTGEVIACGHTDFILLSQDTGRLIGFRVLYHGQSVFQADLIGNMAEVPPRFLLVLDSLSVLERNRVDNKVAVQVVGVQVCGDKHLKSVAPHLLSKLHSDLLGKLRRDVGFLEAEIAVVGLDAVRLVELLFDSDKLLTGNRRCAVDALTEKLLFGFLSILGVVDHISECLIVGIAVLGFGLGGFLRVGGVVEYGGKSYRHWPKPAYCHFRLLSPGRRNCRSTSA